VDHTVAHACQLGLLFLGWLPSRCYPVVSPVCGQSRIRSAMRKGPNIVTAFGCEEPPMLTAASGHSHSDADSGGIRSGGQRRPCPPSKEGSRWRKAHKLCVHGQGETCAQPVVQTACAAILAYARHLSPLVAAGALAATAAVTPTAAAWLPCAIACTYASSCCRPSLLVFDFLEQLLLALQDLRVQLVPTACQREARRQLSKETS